MSKPVALATLLIGVALLQPAPLRAQAPAPAVSAPVGTPVSLRPAPGAPVTLGVASPAHPAASFLGWAAARPVDQTTSLEPVLAPAMAVRHRAPGVVLMIVGGAGILVGALIEEDIVTVAGAGVGLYGLYLYLR